MISKGPLICNFRNRKTYKIGDPLQNTFEFSVSSKKRLILSEGSNWPEPIPLSKAWIREQAVLLKTSSDTYIDENFDDKTQFTDLIKIRYNLQNKIFQINLVTLLRRKKSYKIYIWNKKWSFINTFYCTKMFSNKISTHFILPFITKFFRLTRFSIDLLSRQKNPIHNPIVSAASFIFLVKFLFLKTTFRLVLKWIQSSELKTQSYFLAEFEKTPRS